MNLVDKYGGDNTQTERSTMTKKDIHASLSNSGNCGG
jgi:hypothetical protein